MGWPRAKIILAPWSCSLVPRESSEARQELQKFSWRQHTSAYNSILSSHLQLRIIEFLYVVFRSLRRQTIFQSSANTKASKKPLTFYQPHLTPHTMTGRGGGGGRRVLLPPINFIFKLLQQHSTVQIWLYEQLAIRIEGKIRVSFGTPRYNTRGSADYLCIGIRWVHELGYWRCCWGEAGDKGGRREQKISWYAKRIQTHTSRIVQTNIWVGQILLKGDNVSLIQSLQG